jgi:TPR repeat protein
MAAQNQILAVDEDPSPADKQYQRALRYRDGDGVPRNLKKAVDLLQSAALGGLPDASLDLGLMHLFGMGVPADNALALKWLVLACWNGDKFAPAYLAMIYDNGLGVKRDDAKAIEYCKVASDREDYSIGIRDKPPIMVGIGCDGILARRDQKRQTGPPD